MWNYLLYLAGAIVAVFNHLKDWDAHKTFWRRWVVLVLIIAIGIGGVINNYFTDKKADSQHEADQKEIDKAKAVFGTMSQELHELKKEIKTTGLYKKIASMQAKIEENQKALDSRKASLIFSFGGHGKEAIRSISLPVKDSKVHFDFSIWNDTEINAQDVMLQLHICDGCKYISKPEGFATGVGLADTVLVNNPRIVFGRANTELFSTDIEVPQGVQAVQVGMVYRCSNCVVPKAGEVNENVGLINLIRQ